MKYNYILGLDIGISSVGWGLLALDENNKPYKIIDVGSRIFTPGEVEKTGDSRAKERREKRGSRRVTRRREFRLDRIRNLLYESKLLSGNVSSSIVSEKNNELTILYNNMINNYYKSNNTNPYRLKVEALDRKLTAEELAIILVHYAKKRGYKSNREESNDNDSGKVLSAIKENETIMATNNYRTVSEMYIKDEKFKDKIKNSPGNYKISVTNEMYLDEINKVLDKQIEFGLIDSEFKNQYLEIYNSRRSYDKGPGGTSPYGGDLIKKMTGKCIFDKEPRAPKYAFSSELFVAISKLVNLRYKIGSESYQSLENAAIVKLIDLAKEKNIVTYKDLVKVLNKENVKIKDLNMSMKDSKVIEELRKKLAISNEQEINIYELSEDDKKIYDSIYNEKLFSKTLIELKGYHMLRKVITLCYNKDIWNEVKNNIEFLDELALYCTNYKVNEDIKKEIKSSKVIDSRFEEDDFIKALPNFKDHLMLSTNIIRKLIPIMENGITYDKAMKEIGYNHSDLSGKFEKKDLLVPVYTIQNITNQRVIRSLTQARKIINALIKKYGSPKIINIETARELAKSRKERNEIEKNQQERKAKNEKIKKQLVDLELFSDINKISSNDLLKYKLWQEQKEFCGYSMRKIKIEDLFRNNIVQIDHILPYSRTYNDNYLNKTLVYTNENQDKGNRTPYEWFGKTRKWEDYESFINSLSIAQAKKDNYLLKKLDFDTEREMREQNLNDTKYISKELANLIKAHLKVEKVNTYPGAITGKLRARWGFNRLTHSYISQTYIMPESMKSDIKKDRENHLHHAMDALVIASITPSLQQKITLYEKFSRYIDGVVKSELRKINMENIEESLGEFYDSETGEVKEVEFKEYVSEQLSHGHISFLKHDVSKLEFPLPYEKFVKEAKTRVYEQNIDILKRDLQLLGTYTTEELAKVHTLTPSVAKSKISGKMHEETYYGIKEIKEEEATVKYKTLRTPLEKVKRKDLELIPDCRAGSKDIYNTLVDWFGTAENGTEALKQHEGKYPINPNDKEQQEIKRIRVYSEYKGIGHVIKNSNVEKGGIYRVDIYTSRNEKDEKLYFAAHDIYEIKKIKAYKDKKHEDKKFKIKLDYGQGEKYKIIEYDELMKEYNLKMSIYKNDLIRIILKDGRESIAYMVGCSSGMIEIKSKLGDGYDIIGNNNIFSKKRERYTVTLSTISKIEKISINLLGEISGL